jgi:pimeloyl-ACP methyl ester carboxylesterase
MRDEVVVYVHGLWMNGAECFLLRRRLARRHGLRMVAFRYPTVTCTMAEIVERLAASVRRLDARRLHFVGHSLGGLVIHRFLERHAVPQPGRVVFLGTPSVGCRAAVNAARFGWIAALEGKLVAEELLRPCDRRWRPGRDLGIIAGTRPLGLGQFFGRPAEPCDGTIGVSETRLPGATEHLTLHVSHMGLLLSGQVADATAHFLCEGRFSPRAAGA